MKSARWRVCCFEYFGFNHWQVYRLKSVCAPDHGGNREFKGGLFDSEADAQKYADLLNEYGDVIE